MKINFILHRVFINGIAYSFLLFFSLSLLGDNNISFDVKSSYAEIHRFGGLENENDKIENLVRCDTFSKENTNYYGEAFIAFAEIQRDLDSFIALNKMRSSHKICGKFRHANLAGDSYFLKLSPSVEQKFEEFFPISRIVSVWTHLSCKNITLEVVENKNFQIELYLKDFSSCDFVWKDK